MATNVKGDSEVSLSGNGGKIIRVPDAPLNLINVPSVTSATQIGLEWQEGPINGGTDVIDYLIMFAAVPNEYEVLNAGIIPKSFTAISLTAGVTYKFKV